MEKKLLAKLPFDLTDLVPESTEFELSQFPNEKFTLKRWTLRTRAWAIATYGAKELQEIFSNQKIGQIAEICFFMLEKKDRFPTLDDFLEGISSINDQIGIIKAMLRTLGIGEPEIQAIDEAMKEHKLPKKPANQVQSKPQRTGARSSTP